MKALLMGGRAASPHSGYPHVGDLLWWLFFILRDFELRNIVRVWEDTNGEFLGWTLFSPHLSTFDVFVQAEHRGSSQEEKIFVWSEDRMRKRIREAGGKAVNVGFVFGDDEQRTVLLTAHGFAPQSANSMTYFMQDFSERLPPPTSPDGILVRSIAGEQEADARVRVSYETFHPDAKQRSGAIHARRALAYRKLMQVPGYERTLDLVAVAQDGTFVSFATGWVDPMNKVGEFEPVGTRPAFQGKGLAKAVLLEGLRRMKAAGCTSCIVYSSVSNVASRRLYESVGFRPITKILTYVKKV